MIAAIIILSLAIVWLLYETDFLRVRLETGATGSKSSTIKTTLNVLFISLLISNLPILNFHQRAMGYFRQILVKLFEVNDKNCSNLQKLSLKQ